jgi:predicted dehydrogenase
LKVGVIGLGKIAQIIHLPILEDQSDRYEIYALCDVSPNLLGLIGERYRVDRLYTNAGDLIEHETLDAVFVLNSDEYHTDCVVAALKRGRHVFVEKPLCLTHAEVNEVMRAEHEAGVRVMVGYMRRFAPAFSLAAEEVKTLGKINYVRIRDIIGSAPLIIPESSVVHRFDDVPEEAVRDRAERANRLVREAIGDVSEDLGSAYRLLCGLSSHDISAMRELLGVPKRVVAAAQWNGGRFISAIFQYDDYYASFETGVDGQRRFEAHVEVYGEAKSLKVQYDTPYVRHLPATLTISETLGRTHKETLMRSAFKDSYVYEILHFHDVVAKGAHPKTVPEDFKADLDIFGMIMDALKHEERQSGQEVH